MECLASRGDIDPSGEIVVLNKFCPVSFDLISSFCIIYISQQLFFFLSELCVYALICIIFCLLFKFSDADIDISFCFMSQNCFSHSMLKHKLVRSFVNCHDLNSLLQSYFSLLN